MKTNVVVLIRNIKKKKNIYLMLVLSGAMIYFTEDELSKLKEEFGHQQLKIDEYESLKVEYDELHGKVYLGDNCIQICHLGR